MPDRKRKQARVASLDPSAAQLEADILGFVTHMTGDAECALRWYQDEAISAYGGRTGREMVTEGHGHTVLAFLKDLENGATG